MLSIRTQDRMALVPYDRQISIGGSDDNWYLYIITHEFTRLGTYKTKERCLEILDEISRMLTSVNKSADENENIIYDMPKEEE